MIQKITIQNDSRNITKIIAYKGEIIRQKQIEILSHEEQLDILLKLNLKIHPLEDIGCWGIYASTPSKAIERFNLIKHVFPKTIQIPISNHEGDFGVDLYGDIE